MSQNIILKAIGVASKDSFVLEALTTINKILNLEYVLETYAKVFNKSLAQVQQTLTNPPVILFNTIESFNVLVPPEIQLQDKKTNGWFWSGTANNGENWSNYLSVNIKYFPKKITAVVDEEAKRNYTVYFITIVLHELTHWLRFKLEAESPKNPYPGKPDRESGENLELALLGGRMASYYFQSHGDEFKIDGIVLLLSERDQPQSIPESPCRILTQKYFDLLFEDTEQLPTEFQRMRLDIGTADGLPSGASLKTPLCGCEDIGGVVNSAYEIVIAKRPMDDKKG